MKQEPENLPAKTIGYMGLGLAAVTAVLFGIAWALVRPTPSYVTLPPSVLEHGLFGPREPTAPGTPDEWLDRVPPRPSIERAIDEVVADPSLIGGRR